MKKLVETIAVLGILTLFVTGCKKTLPVSNNPTNDPGEIKKATNGITPYSFNWETVDWMPTPPGQSQIPPPWIGQGSLASLYGIDVINDRRAADGWQLLYNTFNPNAGGSLVNPYFILYNKYRGLLRIYLYTTTQFVQPSTYIVDGLTVVSNIGTTMLNYLGTDITDPSQKQSSFSQIEHAPTDGSQPLASNKWYMLQYEMAYDPNITNLTYQDIQLSWFTNFNSVSSISLGGTITGTLKTPVGSRSDALNTALQNAGTVAAQAAVSLLGSQILNNNGDGTSGDNSLGLPNDIYKSIRSGVNSALSSASGNVTGAISGLLSAVIGGSSSSPTINLNLNATISLQGTQTTSGSFPSSPTSVYVPGSIIPSSAQNYIPLSNEPLGVFNLTAKPVIQARASMDQVDGYYYTEYFLGTSMDQILAMNPAVFNNTGAYPANMHFQIVIPELIPNNIQPENIAPDNWNLVTGTGNYEKIGKYTAITQALDGTDEARLIVGTYTYIDPSFIKVALRVSFDVFPTNGGPKSKLVKTFWATIQPI